MKDELGPRYDAYIVEMQRMRQELLDITRRLARLGERAEDVLDLFTQLVKRLPQREGGPAPKEHVSVLWQVLKSDRKSRMLLKAAAESGVERLHLETRASGDTAVQVDKSDWFVLPGKVGALLAILARPEGGQSGQDGLVPWKSRAEITALLSKRLGEAIKEDAVTNLIHRLRVELVNQGQVNPYLVQTLPGRGQYRFALRVRS